MKKFKIKYTLIPICVLAIVIIGINQISLFNKNNSENRWSVKKIYRGQNSITDAISKTQFWEQKNISQQFNELDYNNIKYLSRTTKISSNKIGEKIDTVSFTGYDSYEDMFHKKNGDIYFIKELSQECAIAVKFENDNDFYVYVNSNYSPETLEQFITDLKLNELLSFGSIWYKYYNDKDNISEAEIIEFPDVSDDIIWQLLFDDIISQNINNENNIHNTIMDIDISIPMLGYDNATVSISQDGYLTTNILDTSKVFYIGEEKVKEFVNYVIENCVGYKIEYVYDEDEIEKKSTDNDTILMYDKSTNIITNVTINSNSNKDAVSTGYNPQNN